MKGLVNLDKSNYFITDNNTILQIESYKPLFALVVNDNIGQDKDADIAFESKILSENMRHIKGKTHLGNTYLEREVSDWVEENCRVERKRGSLDCAVISNKDDKQVCSIRYPYHVGDDKKFIKAVAKQAGKTMLDNAIDNQEAAKILIENDVIDLHAYVSVIAQYNPETQKIEGFCFPYHVEDDLRVEAVEYYGSYDQEFYFIDPAMRADHRTTETMKEDFERFVNSKEGEFVYVSEFDMTGRFLVSIKGYYTIEDLEDVFDTEISASNKVLETSEFNKDEAIDVIFYEDLKPSLDKRIAVAQTKAASQEVFDEDIKSKDELEI